MTTTALWRYNPAETEMPRPEDAVRVIFMGTPDFSVPCLRTLLDADVELAGVFTQPDRPSGRGRRVHSSPVKLAAQAAGVPVYEPQRPGSREWVGKLERIAPDLIVTVAYGHILRPAVLAVPKLGCINVHASLLPRHRGASPIAAAILCGDSHTGITVIRMSPRMDDGDIIAQKAIPIADGDTAGTLHDKLAVLAAEVLAETLEGFRTGTVVYRKQDESMATCCAKLAKAGGSIDWTAPAEAVCRHIRAMCPWPGACGTLGGRRITVLQADVCGEMPAGEPGTIVRAGRDGIVVCTSEGCVTIRTLKPASGKPMAAADFINGHDVRPGDRFGTAG